LAKKTAARDTIINKGARALASGYLNANVSNMPFSQRPTSISVFPHVGMISNMDTYTTENQVRSRDVLKNPTGVDDYTSNRINNIRKNDIKHYKNHWLKSE
jgi:hypothetical protein